MKKTFVNPFCEVIRFGMSDVVCTSGDCCDVGGIPFDNDDETCASGDAECSCGVDVVVNCKT